jgi:GMP synthase (glutamine-hydrolysing)
VRVLGDVCAPDALDTIRMVDEIYINAIKDAGLYDKIWQAFAVFLPIKSVGGAGRPADALARRRSQGDSRPPTG